MKYLLWKVLKKMIVTQVDDSVYASLESKSPIHLKTMKKLNQNVNIPEDDNINTTLNPPKKSMNVIVP